MRTSALTAPRLNGLVVLPVLALLGIGLLFIWSATFESGSRLWVRQLLFIAAGGIGAGVVMHVGVHRLAQSAYEIYGVLLVVLLLLPLLASGSTVGSDRWIPLPFGFKLQPSEFMKVGLVLALARYLQHRGVTNTWRSYLTPLMLTAVPWFLVMRQPDLGTSLVMLPVFVAMVSVSGARMLHVTMLAALAVLLVILAYLVPGVLEPYQKERLDAFTQPIPVLVAEAYEKRDLHDHDGARAIERDISRLKRGTGYQQFYSVVAIGSGGLTGTGLGNGIQNRGNRLPVRHADFIFAVIGEEWGLAGASLVVLLFAALTAAVLGVAYRTREPFGRMVCVGIAALLGGQSLMNLGIATGMLPVTGLPLPLVSYGGSSVLSTLLALGCVLDIDRRQTPVFFES